jgi:hypothetical protein
MDGPFLVLFVSRSKVVLILILLAGLSLITAPFGRLPAVRAAS